MKKSNDPLYLVIDLFCGAGGVSTGFVQAMNEGNMIVKVIAAINHDHKAILSHWSNHKDIKHFEEDIRNLDLTELVELVNKYRKLYPNAKIILWASLECTEYSKAKGGLSRDADSRTLANSLHMKWNEAKKEYEEGDSYMQLINPDYLMIENVVEFMVGGPTQVKMKNGKPVRIKNKHNEWVDGHEPIPKTKGLYFKKWCDDVCKLGYVTDWKQMNSADFGAYTSRNRLFGIFARDESEIVWPKPTHSKTGKDGLKKWMAVKEKLDFNDEGYSIFYRSQNKDIPKRQQRDIVDATFERIYAGCIKHIAGGKDAFMAKYHGAGGNWNPRTYSLDEPLRTIDNSNRHQLVQVEKASFLTTAYSGDPNSKNVSLDGPARTITKIDHQQLIQTSFLANYYGNGDNTHSVEGPAPVIPAADVSAVVQASFIDKQYGGPDNHQSIEQPAGVIVKNDKHSLIQASFIDRPFTEGGGKNSSVEEPVGSITTVPKLNLVQADQLIDSTQYTNTPTPVADPLPTITANRKYPYLLSFQYQQAQMRSIDQPAATILATGHKTPLYLFYTETGEAKIQVFETDSEIIIKLKEFMALYNITDIKMRMLRVDELLKIQGFPDEYRLIGTQEENKKHIGNSVVPQVVKSWIEAMADNLLNTTKTKVA